MIEATHWKDKEEYNDKEKIIDDKEKIIDDKGKNQINNAGVNGFNVLNDTKKIKVNKIREMNISSIKKKREIEYKKKEKLFLKKEELVKKSLLLGAKNYIIKPLDRKKVLERIGASLK